MSAPATLLAVLLLAACGGAAAPAVAADTQAAIARAEGAERARRYDAARRLYHEAVDRAPDRASRAFAARALVRALVFWGEHAAAEAALRDHLAREPDDVGAWHDLGILRHELGDLPGAEAALRRSIALRPRDPRSRIALAALLWRQKRHAEALTQYRALRALSLPERVRDKVEWAISTLEQRVADAPAR